MPFMPFIPPFPAPSRQSLVILALVFALLMTGFQALRKDFKDPVADARIYLIGGAVLEKTGLFQIDTKLLTGETDPALSGRNHFFMPGVSLLYAAIMRLDSQFKSYSYCHLLDQKPADGCGDPGMMVKILQIMTLGLAAWLGYLLALAITQRQSIAWITLILMMASGRYGLYARQFLSDGYALLAITAAMLCLLHYVRRANAAAAIGLALALVVGSYVRPSILYVFYLLVAAGAAGWLLHKWRPCLPTIRPGHLILLGIIYIALMFPWAARNAALTGQYALTDGYAGYILVQRLAFNMMSFQEWCVAWIYWLPDFGDKLAASLFKPAQYERLSVVHPDGFYSIGNRAFADEMRQAAGSEANFMPYLMGKLWSEIGTHIWVTLPLLTQGLWVGKIFGLVSFILSVPGLIILKIRGQIFLYLIAALIPVFLLGLHAFASVNVPRYNLALLPVLSLGAAVCFHGIGVMAARKIRKA